MHVLIMNCILCKLPATRLVPVLSLIPAPIVILPDGKREPTREPKSGDRKSDNMCVPLGLRQVFNRLNKNARINKDGGAGRFLVQN
jgi:hypothetical protein